MTTIHDPPINILVATVVGRDLLLHPEMPCVFRVMSWSENYPNTTLIHHLPALPPLPCPFPLQSFPNRTSDTFRREGSLSGFAHYKVHTPLHQTGCSNPPFRNGSPTKVVI